MSRRRTTENAIAHRLCPVTRGQAEARVRSREVVVSQGLGPSLSSSSSGWKSIEGSKTCFAHRAAANVVVVIGNVVVVVVGETSPADGRRPIDGSPLAPVGCIGICSTTTTTAFLSTSSLPPSSSRWRSPVNLARIPPIASSARLVEQRRPVMQEPPHRGKEHPGSCRNAPDHPSLPAVATTPSPPPTRPAPQFLRASSSFVIVPPTRQCPLGLPPPQ
jgi:hypothetical protein